MDTLPVRFYPKHAVITIIHRKIFTRISWKFSILPEILPLKFIQITNFEPSFFGQNTKKWSGKIQIQFGQVTKVFTFFEFGQNTNWKIEFGQNTNCVFKVRAKYSVLGDFQSNYENQPVIVILQTQSHSFYSISNTVKTPYKGLLKLSRNGVSK